MEELLQDLHLWYIISHFLGIHSKLNSMAYVRDRTIPTERPLPVGEVSANFCG
jgi:hypothetical protein